MDFEFSSQHEQVRETIARFVAEEIAPLVAEAEETETFPRHLFRKWGELGLLGVRYPEADGGTGFDKISDCIVREELSRVCQAFASSWSAHTHLACGRSGGSAPPTRRRASSSRVSPARRSGASASPSRTAARTCGSMKTRADKVAGGWRLNGTKLYITNAPIADFLLVAARTGPS